MLNEGGRPERTAPCFEVMGMLTGSIPGAGQGLAGGVDSGDPAVCGHDPLAVVHAAHIRLVGELRAVLEAGEHSAVYLRGLHLPEVAGHHAEHHHELSDVLVVRQAQGGGGSRDDLVLLGAQVVRQGPVLVAAEVGLVDDLVAAPNVVGTGDDLVQPDRGGQGDSDR